MTRLSHSWGPGFDSRPLYYYTFYNPNTTLNLPNSLLKLWTGKTVWWTDEGPWWGWRGPWIPEDTSCTSTQTQTLLGGLGSEFLPQWFCSQCDCYPCMYPVVTHDGYLRHCNKDRIPQLRLQESLVYLPMRFYLSHFFICKECKGRLGFLGVWRGEENRWPISGIWFFFPPTLTLGRFRNLTVRFTSDR